MKHEDVDYMHIISLVAQAAEAKQAGQVMQVQTLMDEAICIAEKLGEDVLNLRIVRETFLTEFTTNIQEVDWTKIEKILLDAYYEYSQQNNLIMQIDTLINLTSLAYNERDNEKATNYLHQVEILLNSVSGNKIKNQSPNFSGMSSELFLRLRHAQINNLRQLIE